MMTARASIRHFPGLWLPNRKPLPQERVRFDPGFAREFGLAGGWVFLNLAARDLTPNRKHANIVGSSIQLVSALAGTAAWFSGDNSTDRLDLGPITSDDPLSLVDAPGVTVAFRAFRESGATNNFPRIIDKSSGGSAQAGWAIWWTSNAFEFSGTGDSFGITFTYSATDQWDNVAFKGDLGGASIANEAWFLNGVSQSTSGNATGTFSRTTTDAAIGNWNHAEDREWHGGIEYVYVFATAMPDSVLTNLQREPYRYLEAEPASAVVFLPRPAAGGGDVEGPLAARVQHMRAAFGMVVLPEGALAGRMQHTRAVFAAEQDVQAAFSTRAQHVRGVAAGLVSSQGSLQGRVQHARGALVGQIISIKGGLQGRIQHVRSAFAGWVQVFGSLSARLQHVRAALLGTQVVKGALDSRMQHLRAAFTGAGTIFGSLNGRVHHIRAAFNKVTTHIRKIWFMTKRQLWTRGFKRR